MWDFWIADWKPGRENHELTRNNTKSTEFTEFSEFCEWEGNFVFINFIRRRLTEYAALESGSAKTA